MRLLAAAVAVLGGCRPELGPPPPVPPSQRQPESRNQVGTSSDAPTECVPLAEAEVMVETFERGVAKLEEARDGEHYLVAPFEAGIEALKIAAHNGHLQAMSLYGRTVFGARFTNQAPTPEEKEDYVSAVAFLRMAAKAGDADAVGYMPGLLLDGPPFAEPLASLPDGWAMEAFARADAWIECYGLPASVAAAFGHGDAARVVAGAAASVAVGVAGGELGACRLGFRG